ncbi:hypothetical protein BGZ46_008037 [Entomortierella lignicola]|nr:hypothetical protein BGZ46_008037 [Entomortierella lignicola]
MNHRITLPPEIFAFISDILKQNELFNCTLVCKEWNAIFTPKLYTRIRISSRGFHSFSLSETLQKVANYAKNICSIEAPHPSFVPLLLQTLAPSNTSTEYLIEPCLPNVTSLTVLYDQEIFRFLRPPRVQPQFLYPSDTEDMSDIDEEDSEDELDQTAYDPTKGVYREIWAREEHYIEPNCPTQDPFDVIQLVRQCPNLSHLKVEYRVLGNSMGLYHLLWPGILPQSLERLEIFFPDHWEDENLYEDSLDEDYDPSLHPMRDVDEEYEEDDDDELGKLDSDSNDGYDEDEVVQWYHAALQIPPLPERFTQGFLNYFGDGHRQPLLNLREITIKNPEVCRNFIWSFIEYRCPHLKSMNLMNPSDHFCHNFYFRRERTARELEDIRLEILDDQEYFDDEFLSCVLHGAAWKRITLRNYLEFSDSRLLISEFSRLADSIEVLDFGFNAGTLGSRYIQRLLATLHRLRVFTGDGLYFLARCAGPQLWACAETLEVFRCQILLEIPLIDSSIDPPPTTVQPGDAVTMDGDGNLVPDAVALEQGQANAELSLEEVEQRMMMQLGRCYQLQELDLSHWGSPNSEVHGSRGLVLSVPGLMTARDGHVDAYSDSTKCGPQNRNVRLPWSLKNQSKCLQFTFKTGLRELRGLKNLRKVDLTGLNHGISVGELRWMRKEWPQLEQFEGLFNDHEVFEDEQEEDIEIRRKRNGEMREWLTGSEINNTGFDTFWRMSKLD